MGRWSWDDGMMDEQTFHSTFPAVLPSPIPIAQPSVTDFAAPGHRLIILGASNVTRSFGTLVAMARSRWNAPLEILAAHGHGRSYGAAWSTVMVRKLPGILPSGLWDAMGRALPLPTTALVTDIGNDILYEFSVPVIAGWVEACLDRLAAFGAQTVVSALPVENIFELSAARYKFFRSLFVPGCSLRLLETTERAIELNDRVSALVKSRGMKLITPCRQWYGLDPIHVRRRASPAAWRAMLGDFRTDRGNIDVSRGKLAESLYLRCRLPERVRWFGRELGALQPSARLRDGTTVALY